MKNSKVIYKYNFKISVLVLILSLFACQAEDNLDTVLSYAGDNRGELEKVLTHYRISDPDSLKYEAARFLIENMPGHYSYEDTVYMNKYYNAIDSVALLYRDSTYEVKKVFFQQVTDSFSNRNQKMVEDIHIIKAQYLIDNIDRAFDLWRKSEWAQHVNFNDFCEYLLPYKVCETQTLDNWREYMGTYGDTLLLGQLHYCQLYKNSAYMACATLNRNLRDSVHPRLETKKDMIPVRRIRTLLNIPSGVCDDYNIMALALMRAHGVPVVKDFITQWPFRDSGHSWDVLLETSGKRVVLQGADAEPASPHKEDHPMAKIFRQTYARNAEIEEIYQLEHNIPSAFRTPFMKDVTEEYMATVDIDVMVEKNTKHDFAYLAVFDNVTWVPVQWGKITKGRAHFSKMGKRIVYLPVFYDNEGIKPFSDPIIVTASGKIHRLKPDTIVKKQLKLVRKYPAFEGIYEVSRRIVGGRMQIAGDSLFKDSLTFFKVKDLGYEGKEIKLDTVARYWRYFPPNGGFCNMAELYFFEKDSIHPAMGKIIGTSGSWMTDGKHNKEAAFDRDMLTFFDAPRGDSCWVGLDFGKSVRITRIVYYPRSDGNCIEIGDEYELFYWANNAWKSLGKKKADNVVLNYDNCPGNALFLLKDLTKGKEERIFTYENGKQVWW